MSASKLEDFPNELFLEIFDNLPPNDGIRAFYNLNRRLNSLLFSSKIHLYILYPDDLRENRMNTNILFDLLINRRYISRLRLVHDDDILHKRFVSFTHIRSLLVDIPTSKLIHMISPEIFPRLEYLRLGYTSAKIDLNKLHQDIFSNAFPVLKKCSLNNVTDNKPWTGSPSIHSLGIWSNNPTTVVERVLSACIYLISLHLFLTWPSTYVILDDNNLVQHSYVKSLKLHLNGHWTLDKFDSLLAYIPTVQLLRLYTSYFDSHMTSFQWDFRQLAYTFLCRLPALSCFDCELICEHRKLIELPEVHSLHPCFNRIQYEIYAENDLFIRIFTIE